MTTNKANVDLISRLEHGNRDSAELARQICGLFVDHDDYPRLSIAICDALTDDNVGAAYIAADCLFPASRIDITSRDDRTGYACVWGSRGNRSSSAPTPARAVLAAVLRALST